MATNQKHLTPLYGYDSAGWTAIQPPSSIPSREDGPSPKKFKILTYNIWFDAVFRVERCAAVMRIVEDEEPDILCLQEVTSGYEAMLRDNPYFRENWYMTGLDDVKTHTESRYGTSMMVRRGTLERLGLWANAFLVDFPGTKNGRVLLGLEIADRNTGDPTFNFGTIHLDYTPEQRAIEFGICVQSMGQSINGAPVTASLFCGDTNIRTYSETRLPLAGGYEDAWMTAHPLTPAEERDWGTDLLNREVTFGKFGIRRRGRAKPLKGDGDPRRLDLVFSKGFKVGGCRRVGDVPIDKRFLRHLGEPKMGDLELYPSDHVGVITELEC